MPSYGNSGFIPIFKVKKGNALYGKTPGLNFPPLQIVRIGSLGFLRSKSELS